MARTKKMDEGYFASLIKDFNAFGELVRARQDEKQAVLDQFDTEAKRFFFGKISEKALASSVKKTNRELERLDRDIRKAITHAKHLIDKTRSFVSKQAPDKFRATLAGMEDFVRKKTVKKKVPKRAATKKKMAKKKAKKKTTKKKTKKKKKK